LYGLFSSEAAACTSDNSDFACQVSHGSSPCNANEWAR
jgi:hypothetical protein